MSWLEFKSDNPAGQELARWHRALADNRGDRAALRRCGTLVEVAFVPAFHQLSRALRAAADAPVNPDRLLAVAGLVAIIKQPIANSLPRQMATPNAGGTSPVVSGLRFRRLLQCQTQDELFTTMRRILRLLDDQANLCDLANSVYGWNERTRKRWAYEYYGVLPR
jgi:CRISPR system Cascade subunit CasB